MSGFSRFLVTVADDFGKSPSVNAAVAEAHDKGFLTSASLMAGGEAFDDAVRVAGGRKDLSVGIHITLCDGKAVLSPSRIDGLVGRDGCFTKNPAEAWMRCSVRALRPQIENEVKAQFDRLAEAGIRPTHIDAHHHLQMHPVIFDVLCREASERGIGWMRISGEPFSALLDLSAWRRGVIPFFEWAVFGILGGRCRRAAERKGLHFANRVFGLSRTGFVDETYIHGMLVRLKGPVDEVFAHPDLSTERGRRECNALTSPSIKEAAAPLGISLAGYGELKRVVAADGSAWEKP